MIRNGYKCVQGIVNTDLRAMMRFEERGSRRVCVAPQAVILWFNQFGSLGASESIEVPP